MNSGQADDALLRGLGAHNPWWDEGAAAFSLPARQKSDFYHLVRPEDPGSQITDQPILALVGRRGAGKTTLLEEFINHEIEAGADPAQFCYVPFDANPLYQLRSATQLRRAVRYYESRILSRAEEPTPQFLILDDVHRIEHPTKPNSTGWGEPVQDLAAEPQRYVVLTASAGIQIRRELGRVGVPESDYDIQPILPEKFRDYIHTLYPELEVGHHRVTPTPVREGAGSLPRALETGSLEPLLDTLRDQYGGVAEDARRIQSQVLDYLAMGGILSYAQEGPVASARELPLTAYRRLRGEVRDALYQDVPAFETIQTIADLERLCAVAAAEGPTEPLRYQWLVDQFDVDRRTIADSYLPALAQLYLLTGVTEYDNDRPRSVRLYLRDTGLAMALTETAPRSVVGDVDKETDLAHLAGFDHTMRFAYGITATNGDGGTPSVQFWDGPEGVVDFVFEVDGRPVPVGFAYRPPIERTRRAVEAFLDRYDCPVGFLLVGDTVATDRPITLHDGRIIQLPYWFYLLLC